METLTIEQMPNSKGLVAPTSDYDAKITMRSNEFVLGKGEKITFDIEDPSRAGHCLYALRPIEGSENFVCLVACHRGVNGTERGWMNIGDAVRYVYRKQEDGSMKGGYTSERTKAIRSKFTNKSNADKMAILAGQSFVVSDIEDAYRLKFGTKLADGQFEPCSVAVLQ